MGVKVSVVTIVYNDIKGIEKTIKSVLGQSFDSVEYIIIDGGSTDGTVDVIKRFNKQLAFFLSEKDNGIYDAMNKSIAYCNGEYTLFMNSGDCFAEKESLSKVFNEKRSQDVIYGDALYFYGAQPIRIKPKEYHYLKYEMPFNHQATLVKTSLLRKYPFDTKYKYAADYDFFHKLYNMGCSFLYVNTDISEYHLEGGASKKNIVKCYKEVSEISTERDLKHYWILAHAYAAEFYYNVFNQHFLDFFRRLKY